MTIIPSQRMKKNSRKGAKIAKNDRNIGDKKINKRICHVSVHNFSVIFCCVLSVFPLAIFATLRENNKFE